MGWHKTQGDNGPRPIMLKSVRRLLPEHCEQYSDSFRGASAVGADPNAKGATSGSEAWLDRLLSSASSTPTSSICAGERPFPFSNEAETYVLLTCFLCFTRWPTYLFFFFFFFLLEPSVPSVLKLTRLISAAFIESSAEGSEGSSE